MNKTIKLVNYIVIPVILFLVAIYMGDFKALDWIESFFIVFLSITINYLCSSNESLECDIEKKNTDLNSLQNKLTQMSLYINGNTPYIIQSFVKHQSDDTTYIDTWYDIEIIVSTIEKQYSINYINISFNPDVELNEFTSSENDYILLNPLGQVRSGVKEYNFKIKDHLNSKSVAKLIIKVKFKQIGDNVINIEVLGNNPAIKRIESKCFSVVS